MTKNDRRTQKLLALLQMHKRLEVKQVIGALEVSESTARRLFARLEEEGKLLRVRGAIQLAPQLGYDYSYQAAVSHRSQEKSIIGRAAAELVEDHDRVFLDAGTTVLHLAEILSVKIQTGALQNIVVVTNALTYIETLAKWCKVILLGGEIRVENQDVCGPIAEKSLMMFHVNKAFLGTNAVSPEHGLMATDERTSKINELAVKHADKVYVLADSEKFQKSSFISYAPLDAVDTIFTDSGLSQELFDLCTSNGAHIERLTS
jgi:DeoR family fructose operon transcriptional repressor